MPKYKPVVQTPEQIDAMANELSNIAIDLKVAADRLRSSGFSEVPVGGYGQIATAIKFANAYSGSVKDAIFKSRKARGDFDSGEPKAKKQRVRKSDTGAQE